ncbi:MAG: amidohydrolase family protein [Clostridia bacterium]|nr:amidohydrolase family protein [Clostridia bacterium]
MKNCIYAEQFLQNGSWRQNVTVHCENGRISWIEEGKHPDAVESFAYLTPGLVDNHIHGGDGVSVFGSTVEEIETWLVKLAEAGTAGIMLSPSGQPERIRKGLANIKAVMERQKNGQTGGARILGAHLEGPFISEKRPGAMEAVIPPSVETFRMMTEGYEDVVKEMTIAPENEGAAEVIAYLREQGIRVQAGHTDCDYETALAAFANGVGSTCHTFNAARPIHHREPGILTAALTDPEIYCEMIGDLAHLHPGTMRLLRHCKGRERLMLVSDAVMTTHLPDGIYGRVEVKNGVNRVKELGCLSGGGCYTAKSVKNLTEIGFTFDEAVMAGAVNPVRYLGLDLTPEPGNHVFLTGWNEAYEPVKVMIETETYTCR